MNTMSYKGYEGSAVADVDDLVCHGRLLFIDDLIMYEATTVPDLIQAFHEAVDEYIRFCRETGKEQQRPWRGLFNVRVAPALHRAAALRAMQEDVSLNEVIARALDAYLNARAGLSMPSDKQSAATQFTHPEKITNQTESKVVHVHRTRHVEAGNAHQTVEISIGSGR